jgi:hypothetical protein
VPSKYSTASEVATLEYGKLCRRRCKTSLLIRSSVSEVSYFYSGVHSPCLEL